MNKINDMLKTIEKLKKENQPGKNQNKINKQWEEIQAIVSVEERVNLSPKLDKAWSIAWDKGH